MSFLVSTVNTVRTTVIGDVISSSGLFAGVNFNYFLAGDIFEPDISVEDIYNLILSKSDLSILMGEFSLLLEDDDYIYIINDEIATIKWYYYFNNDEFIISNNFWEIAYINDIGIDDINVDGIYEQLMMNQSLSNQTILKNINIVPAGSILCFAKREKTLSIKKHSDIVYKDDLAEIDKIEVFNKIDQYLEKTIDRIMALNKDAKVGVTISGGLDSRFPLPYIEQLENSKVSYLIGTHKGWLNAYDYKSAKAMADMYDIRLKFVNPFIEEMDDKIKIDILRNPNQSSNILKAINFDRNFHKNEFNVLLTGAYGGLIGGRVLNKKLLNSKDIDSLSMNLFYDYSQVKNLIKLEKGLSKLTFLKDGLQRVFKLFFKSTYFDNINIKEESVNEFVQSEFLIPKTVKRKLYDNMKLYVEEERENKKNNISIIMKLHLFRHSITGAFESLHGQVKAYSIYHPYIYEYSKIWPISFLENRSIMEEFLLYKHKKLADIPLQSYEMPIKYRFKKNNIVVKIIVKVKALLNFMIRGLSIDYTSWWHNENVQEIVKDTFAKEDSYFYKIFKKQDINILLEYPRHSHVVEHLLKIKLTIDMIETGEYVDLLEFSLKETDKY